MRKFVFVAAVAGTALLVSACSDDREETTAQGAATGAGTEIADAATASSQVLNANSATAQQLMAVDGMSEELAAAIVAGRPYSDASPLDTKLREMLAPSEASALLVRVFVPVNLNEGSEDAIKLIPGMTDKMVHEFLEYRPYEDMAEFDREIGKYVDEAEVARFRNYVTL